MGLWRQLIGEEPDIFEKIFHVLKHGSDTGEIGEWLTEYALKSLGGEYLIFRNLYLPYRGRTSELDILFLHERGIYILESKNYSGWIFGRQTDKYWTQCLNKKERNRFYNPILQNQTHIKALSQYLSLPGDSIKSIIVFSERCELKSVPPSSETVLICQRQELLKLLKADLTQRPVLYDHDTLQRFRAQLEPCGNKSQEEKAAHIQNLQNAHGAGRRE